MPNLELVLDWAERPFIGVLLGVLLGILIMLVGRWLARLISRYMSRSMERAHVDSTVVRFTRTLIYTGLMVAVIIAALDAAGLHTTANSSACCCRCGYRFGLEGLAVQLRFRRYAPAIQALYRQ